MKTIVTSGAGLIGSNSIFHMLAALISIKISKNIFPRE